jgi:hypothetical protein
MSKISKIRVFAGVTMLAVLALGTGCSKLTGDTSGYKPPPTLTREQADKQIAAIKANPKIPAGLKQMAIQSVENQVTPGH